MSVIDHNNLKGPQRRASGFSPLLSKELLYTMAAVWVVGMFAALVAFGTFKADAAPSALDYASRCSVGFAVASVLSMFACRLVAGRVWSRSSCVIVGALTALMFVGVAVNMAGYLAVPGSTWAHPALPRWSDSYPIYEIALDMYAYGFGTAYDGTSPAWITAGLMRLFGPGLLAPLLFHTVCMSLSAVLAGRVCVALCPGGNVLRRAWVGTLLFAMIPSVPYYGAMLMKEAPVTLAVTLQALMLADIYHGRLRAGSLVGAAIAAVLLILERHTTGYLMALGTVCCFIHSWRSATGRFTERYNATLAMLLLCLATVACGDRLRPNSDFVLLNTSEATSSDKTMMGYETVSRYSNLIEGYYDKNIFEKATYLPLTAAAQYFPPFPWNYTRDVRFGAFAPVAHLSILWYIVGGLVLGFFALCIYRRRAAGGLAMWALFWLLAYMGIALMSAGSVARYHLCLAGVGVPLALRLLLCLRHGVVSRRAFYTYASVYAVLLACGLAMAYKYLEA